MRPYGIDTNQRRNLIIWMIVISFLAAPLIDAVLNWFDVGYPAIVEYAIDVGSAAGLFYILVSLLETHLWRNEFCRWIFGISVPNIGGHWEGELRSSYDNFETVYPITLDIKQEWSEISVRLTRPKGSGSKSTTASMFLRAGDMPVITYTYHNDPNQEQVETMHSHDGTAILDINLGNVTSTLEGTYYTGRDRRTYGTMNLTRNEPDRKPKRKWEIWRS